MRTTHENIVSLKKNEVFVFGSNLSGIHGGGAARIAMDKFGAVYGYPTGLQDQSYAIPTKSKNIARTLTVDEIEPYVAEFIDFATDNSELHFLVTEIGCGLAGHVPEDIAPLFIKAIHLNNISLPKRFWDVINSII